MFNIIEKDALAKILDKFGGQLCELTPEEIDFLDDENLLRFQRNYAIFPKKTHR